MDTNALKKGKGEHDAAQRKEDFKYKGFSKGRGYGDRNGYGYFKKRSNVAKAKDLATATTTPSEKATPFWRKRTRAQERIRQKERKSKGKHVQILNGTQALLQTTNAVRTELAPGLHYATVTGNTVSATSRN